MFATYLRFEDLLRRQDLAAFARGLLAFELAAATVLLLFGAGSDDLARAIAMLLGAPVIVLGLVLRERSLVAAKIAVAAGGFPATFLFSAVEPLAGFLAMVAYFIAVLVSLVA